MTEQFMAKHKATIDKAINSTPVLYSVSGSTSTDKVVHCYYLNTKDVNICVYVIKTTKSSAALGHIAKITVKSNTGNKRQDHVSRDNGKIAKSLYEKLYAKYTEQVARTKLKHNWRNRAFVHKR